MADTKPEELTKLEWQLLLHLSTYSASFSSDFVYSNVTIIYTDRLLFNKLFYRLAGLFYIQLHGVSEAQPSEYQDFYYVLTRKGRHAVAKHTQNDEDDIFSG